jgi:hypothetical protein
MQRPFVLLHSKVLLAFRYGGFSVTQGRTLDFVWKKSGIVRRLWWALFKGYDCLSNVFWKWLIDLRRNEVDSDASLLHNGCSLYYTCEKQICDFGDTLPSPWQLLPLHNSYASYIDSLHIRCMQCCHLNVAYRPR